MLKLNLLLIFALVSISISNGFENSKITLKLKEALRKRSQVDIFISFEAGTQNTINHIETLRLVDRYEKITALVQSLEENAEKSQREVKQYLMQQRVEFKSYWISNQIYIQNAYEEIINNLSKFEKISEFDLEIIAHIPDKIHVDSDLYNVTKQMPRNEPQWGVKRVNADKAWSITKGEGIKIGFIDTGVRGTHILYADRYVGNNQNGWYDPFYMTKQPTEYSSAGHGTHVTGIAVGEYGYGVAPMSQWMACVGCDYACPHHALIACGEFMLCPGDTNNQNKNCSYAPDIVSNSYGGLDDGQNYMDSVISAWIAADIIPVFGIGNDGPYCVNGFYPGTHSDVITVGSIGQTDAISRFSSKGPNNWGDLKPEISAPGEVIWSASHTTDNHVVALQGTSMATPFVSGSLALLLTKEKNRKLKNIKKKLGKAADKQNLSERLSCMAKNNDRFPNNVFGHGVVNAYKLIGGK